MPLEYEESMNQVIEQIMQDSTIRKEFGLRVKQLRKDKGWTQKELGNLIGVSYTQLNKYEGGTNSPPLDKLITLASALNTTIDYLITGNLAENMPIHNTRLIQRFQELESFESDDQETVIKLIDAMIVKRRVEGAVKVERPSQ
jgi:transcriptional regulator with XRE-family HTH domain